VTGQRNLLTSGTKQGPPSCIEKTAKPIHDALVGFEMIIDDNQRERSATFCVFLIRGNPKTQQKLLFVLQKPSLRLSLLMFCSVSITLLSAMGLQVRFKKILLPFEYPLLLCASSSFAHNSASHAFYQRRELPNKLGLEGTSTSGSSKSSCEKTETLFFLLEGKSCRIKGCRRSKRSKHCVHFSDNRI
jgi:hypothetical protein